MRGQGVLELRQPLVNGVPHVEDIQVVLHARRDEHGTLAVVAPEVALLLGAPADIREIAQANDALGARADDRVADLLERFVAARGLQVVAAKPDVHGAAGNAGVLALHRRDHLAERHPRGLEPLEVDRNAHFGFRIGPGLGAANAGRGFDQFLEVFRLLAEFAPVGSLGEERELHDVDRARA